MISISRETLKVKCEAKRMKIKSWNDAGFDMCINLGEIKEVKPGVYVYQIPESLNVSNWDLEVKKGFTIPNIFVLTIKLKLANQEHVEQ